jgi:hypothetical protein
MHLKSIIIEGESCTWCELCGLTNHVPRLRLKIIRNTMTPISATVSLMKFCCKAGHEYVTGFLISSASYWRIVQAVRFLFTKSQFTSAQKASMYFGRRLR